MPDELEAIRAHADNIRCWMLTTNWATADVVREAEAILARLDAAEARVAALEGLRPWVQAIGCIDLSTGRRIVKADVAARFEVGQ